jgi:hypothetical protein
LLNLFNAGVEVDFVVVVGLVAGLVTGLVVGFVVRLVVGAGGWGLVGVSGRVTDHGGWEQNSRMSDS